jgi:hypothetical protein
MRSGVRQRVGGQTPQGVYFNPDSSHGSLGFHNFPIGLPDVILRGRGISWRDNLARPFACH